MLERGVVVRLLVADGEHDAGLAVGQPRDRNARPARAAANCRPSAATTRRQAMRRPAVDAHSGAIGASAPPAPSAGAKTRSFGQRVHVRVQRHPQAARLHHPAERLGPLAGLAVIEMQEQPRGRRGPAGHPRPECPGSGRPAPAAGPTPRRLPAGGASRRRPHRRGHRKPGCSIGGSGARSTTAVAMPSAARRQASVPPTGPAPMTQTSAEIASVIAPLTSSPNIRGITGLGTRRAVSRPVRPGRSGQRQPIVRGGCSGHSRTPCARLGVSYSSIRRFHGIAAVRLEGRVARFAPGKSVWPPPPEPALSKPRRLASPAVQSLMRRRFAELAGLALGLIGLALLVGARDL